MCSPSPRQKSAYRELSWNAEAAMPRVLIAKLQRFTRLSDAEHVALHELTARRGQVGTHADIVREGEPPGPVRVIFDGWARRYQPFKDGRRLRPARVDGQHRPARGVRAARPPVLRGVPSAARRRADAGLRVPDAAAPVRPGRRVGPDGRARQPPAAGDAHPGRGHVEEPLAHHPRPARAAACRAVQPERPPPRLSGSGPHGRDRPFLAGDRMS